MDSIARLRMVHGAIVIIDGTTGWDVILPAAKAHLQRMADAVDAPVSDRQRLSRGLATIISQESSFLLDPIAVDLWRVVEEFPGQ